MLKSTWALLSQVILTVQRMKEIGLSVDYSLSVRCIYYIIYDHDSYLIVIVTNSIIYRLGV